MTIACLGSGSGSSGEPGYDAMAEVGRLLAKGGHIVMTGAYGGTGMEAPARGAKEAGGTTVGITLLGKPGNDFLTETVDCQRQYVKNSFAKPANPLEIQYGIRLGNLLSADGFIIAAGGGPGTIVELMAIINLNSKFWMPGKKTVILKVDQEAVGWNNLMLEQLADWGVLPEKCWNSISVAETPAQAVEWVTKCTF